MAHTFALKQFIYDAYQKNGRRIIRRRYLTVDTGLTFQTAKARQKQERTLQIVPEGPAKAG
jgi:hypothetical protein